MSDYSKSLTATVYIVNGESVLLHMHKKYDTWFPVGGHLERDELPHEAALREAKEESGLDITLFERHPDSFSIGLVKRIPSPVAVYNEGDKKTSGEDFLDFIYAAVTNENDPVGGENESRVFRWFSVRDLLNEKENIKIHIRNTALRCLYYVNGCEGEYFPETEGCVY